MGVFSAHADCALALDSDLDAEGWRAGKIEALVLVAEVQGLILFRPLRSAGNETHNPPLGLTSLVCVANSFETPSCNRFSVVVFSSFISPNQVATETLLKFCV